MMILSIPAATGYSAKVRLELRIGQRACPLAQIGGDRLIFSREVQLPGTSGEVRVCVDEHERRWTASWAAQVSPARTLCAVLTPLA